LLAARACVENGITVECLPGAAFVPAPYEAMNTNDKFILKDSFRKKGRQTRYLEHRREVFVDDLYVSPHSKTLAEFITYFGEDQNCVSRELSKLHENRRNCSKEVNTF
jgi:16S rRNA (cytidine1402-2'-O)-methyltransferase